MKYLFYLLMKINGLIDTDPIFPTGDTERICVSPSSKLLEHTC